MSMVVKPCTAACIFLTAVYTVSVCLIRAPSAKNGLAPMCKDTFAGQCRLRVWELDSLGNKASYTMVDATSKTAALEVGRAGAYTSAHSHWSCSCPGIEYRADVQGQ